MSAEAQAKAPQLPPDVANYIKGATPESLQFDFLIGEWSVDGSRFGPNGELQLNYAATWHAQYLHDKRMVMDDFTVFLPNGQEISSFVTLRTYCSITKRWELAGLAAFQPAVNGKWYGHWVDGEMHLSAEGKTPDGRSFENRIRFHDIGPDSFKWESKMSFDDGNTWAKVASLVATRTKK